MVSHFFKDWKPAVFDKNGGKNKANESSIKVDKCKREFRMFDDRNVNELINERGSDTASFRSGLVANKHIESEVYYFCELGCCRPFTSVTSPTRTDPRCSRPVR